ncbi:MAG: SDR family oxidoreductase [Bacteroidetes bacterium]|nr:SDR family oxidoreductase [Bacteroidota bacterium]
MTMLALITGATSGIGKSCAHIFARHAYNLVVTGRRQDRLNDLKKELEETYKIKVLTLCFDVRKQTEVDAAVASLLDDYRNIDVLVNNAGLAAGLAPIQDGETDDWERMIDTNVKGLLYMTKAVSQLMIARKRGHIINVGSIAGKEVYANGNVYCATKHAVDALNKGMRIDLLPHHIRVSAVNPGMVETEFSLVRFHGDEQRAKQVYAGIQPLTPDDIAETVFWIASRPAHVNINDIVIMPAVQANATTVLRQN